MTFEEYAKDLMLEPDEPDWILAKDAFDAGYTAATFAANSKLGDEGNDGERRARLETAVQSLKANWAGPEEVLREVIEAAQG